MPLTATDWWSDNRQGQDLPWCLCISPISGQEAEGIQTELSENTTGFFMDRGFLQQGIS